MNEPDVLVGNDVVVSHRHEPTPRLSDTRSRPAGLLTDTPFVEEIEFDAVATRVASSDGRFAVTSEQQKILVLLSDGRLFIARDAVSNLNQHLISYITLLQRNQTPFTPIRTSAAEIHRMYNGAGRNDAVDSKGSAPTEMEQDTLRFIVQANAVRASDIHVRANQKDGKVLFRIDGELEEIAEFDPQHALSLIRTYYQVVATTSGGTFEENKRLDARVSAAQSGRLPAGLSGIRIATSPTSEKNVAVLRMLYDTTEASHDLTHYGYEYDQADEMVSLSDISEGINLISGPTGSGKSTTLMCVLSDLAERTGYRTHIITVEDPVEYTIRGAVQTSVGSNARTEKERSDAATDAIRSAMRLDPDTLMVGEIRDLQTAELAFRGALTGHQVWSTLHANSALHNVARLENMGLDRELLLDASVLRGLVAQRLVKKLCPHCRRPLRDHLGEYHPRMVEELKQALGERIQDIHVTNPDGCDHCRKGTNGRTAVVEIVRPTSELFRVWRTDGRDRAKLHWLKRMGGRTFTQHALEKIKAGQVDPFMARKAIGPLVSDKQIIGE